MRLSGPYRRCCRRAMVVLLAASLAGCANRSQPVPELEVSLPRQWQASPTQPESTPDDALHELAGTDVQLRALLAQAWTRNFDIRRATVRWQQAGLARRDRELAHWPSVTASISASASKTLSSPVTEVNVGGVPIQVSGSSGVNKNFGFSLSTSYEADLWGRVAEERKLALASESSSQTDIAAARWLALAQVTEKYWRVAAIDEKLVIENERGKNAEARVAIERAKRDAGVARTVDVMRVEELRQNARKRVAELRDDRARYVREIAILLDGPPHTFSLASAQLPRAMPPIAALDTPIAVIDRRPDLQKARLAMVSAASQLNIAEIDRLPALSLPQPSLSAGAASLRDVLRTPVLSIGTSLTAPILDWGKRLRARDRERMNLDAALLDYTERVHKAVAEVSTLLASTEQNQRQFASDTLRAERQDREFLARQAQLSVGKIEKAQWIEALDAVADTRMNAVDTRLAAWLNRLELRKALASPLSLPDAK